MQGKWSSKKRFLYTIRYPVERYLIGYIVRNKERLVNTLLSNTLLNEQVGYNPSGTSMVTRA